MKYSQLTIKSNNFLKRFSHTSRHKICNNIIEKYKFKTFIDYGSGDGQLIQFLKPKIGTSIYVYELNLIMMKQLKKNLKDKKNIIVIQNKKKLKNNFFDIICINEVFEHLNEENKGKVFINLKKILKKNGLIIISIPIEVGLSSLFKNIIRFFSKSKHANNNIVNTIKSLFYIKIDRGKKKYYKSHIGFNHLELSIA